MQDLLINNITKALNLGKFNADLVKLDLIKLPITHLQNVNTAISLLDPLSSTEVSMLIWDPELAYDIVYDHKIYNLLKELSITF